LALPAISNKKTFEDQILQTA